MTAVVRRHPVRVLWLACAVFLQAPWVGCADDGQQQPTGADLNNQGVQEAKRGDFERGASLLRQAVSLEPGDSRLRKNLSGVLTDWANQLSGRGQTQSCVGLLEEALTYDPDNGKALVLLGDVSYTTLNDLERALASWKRAYGKVPADQWNRIHQRISQTERDLLIERNFTGHRAGHFQIRFENSPGGEMVSMLRGILEQQYARLSDALDVSVENFPVIVYGDSSFKRVVGRKDWALGLYDGRIRLRLEDVRSDHVSSVVAHELAHAVLAKAYGPRIPTWVHEGFAQAQEPHRLLTPREEEMVKAIARGNAWIPLKWLDQRFEQPSDWNDLTRVYLQARFVVEFLIRKEGISRFRAFLKRLSGGESAGQAFDQSFVSLRWSKVDQGVLE